MNVGRDCLREIEAVVLAGGLGTRSRKILGDTPKLLASVGGRPLIEHLIDNFRLYGAQRVLLSLGHLAEEITDYIAEHPPTGIGLVQVTEPSPQGTAGAIRTVAPHLRADTVLVVNGDTLVDSDLCAFLAAHRDSGAPASLLCTSMSDTGRYGRVEICETGRILSFAEKSEEAGSGIVSAGVYLLEKEMVEQIQRMPGPSLERDIFAALPSETLNAFTGECLFIDIGTVEGLADAQHHVALSHSADTSPDASVVKRR